MEIYFSEKFRKDYKLFSNDIKKVVKAKLKILSENPHHPSLRTKKIKGQEDILSLIKIHFLTEFNPELELVRINANRKIEQVLGMPEGPDRETALEDAKKYSQIMNLRSPEQAERRVKFMARYGGYAYVYPVSARAYWAWFEKHDQTPEAMLRLMREPIILGVNEEMPEIS